jgi:hypothetical protein
MEFPPLKKEKSNMSTILKHRQQLSQLAAKISLSRASIKGDLCLTVTESDAAHGPIKGSYKIEIEEMQEPLQVSWGVEGHVMSRQGRATDIAFEISEAQAGQTWIYAVQAQVTDRWRSIVTGVFVQIFVTPGTFFKCQ